MIRQFPIVTPLRQLSAEFQFQIALAVNRLTTWANQGRVIALVDATDEAKTYTLPDAAQSVDFIITVKKVDASANAVTVDTVSSQTIDGAGDKSLSSQWDFITVYSNGVNWFVI